MLRCTGCGGLVHVTSTAALGPNTITWRCERCGAEQTRRETASDQVIDLGPPDPDRRRPDVFTVTSRFGGLVGQDGPAILASDGR